MKSKLYYLLAIVLLASCSAPKYAYHFDRYDYNSGKKSERKVAIHLENDVAPVDAEQLLASKGNTFLVAQNPQDNSAEVMAVSPTEVRKTYAQMSKSERKELRTDIKKYIKEKKESVTATKKANAMDNDLRLAAIFGAIGFVALIISGDVFYILGGIAMIIGVVFFVKWLVRQ
ncbi:MAG TPA: hypothetical protein PKN99_09160 [Cyclobacteriaceae bacterium]|jgi:hypothetical protein|nr:hypothetical protein [Cyclobacteriaceae bacterium]HNP07786.1 hypothetical protein [Cyclobacteriaceae bacterium]